MAAEHVRFRLGLTELAATSFACSALQEAALSLRMWTHPGHYLEQAPWFRDMTAAFRGLDTEMLRSLVASNRWIPDFLTPCPTGPFPDLASEFAHLRATPPELLRPALESTFLPHDRTLPRPLRDGLARPERLLSRIADALEAYWHVCLAPRWWPRARAVLEGDILYRARRLAQGGADALFSDFDPRVSWRGGSLVINWPCGGLRGADVRLDGTGLVLVPTLFAHGAVTAIDPGNAPWIAYPARGRGTMAENVAPVAPDRGLRDLLGARRAQLLLLLADPATTTDLAGRLGVTPAAISQHLAVLFAARLVSRTRHGRSVLYARSALGDELCR